jgi:hypothetical protein
MHPAASVTALPEASSQPPFPPEITMYATVRRRVDVRRWARHPEARRLRMAAVLAPCSYLREWVVLDGRR